MASTRRPRRGKNTSKQNDNSSTGSKATDDAADYHVGVDDLADLPQEGDPPPPPQPIASEMPPPKAPVAAPPRQPPPEQRQNLPVIRGIPGRSVPRVDPRMRPNPRRRR